ncbi:MAG: hypothetical protein QNJ09_07745 [Paracoccaceae bacterium]|nr:hypothetical protein [Paracoccaceae bacterium]
MVKALSVLLVSALVLTSCGTIRDSRLNPFNWFGRSTSEPVASETVNPLIPRRRASIFRASRDETYLGRPVAEISQLVVERRPGGAIIRVEGIADRAGPFDVRLIKDDGASTGPTLAYTLRALQAAGPRNLGPRARTVTAAVFVSESDLLGIRTIRVTGARNAQVTRR